MATYFFAQRPSPSRTTTTASSSTTVKPRKKVDRPKGLWRARVTLSAPPRCLLQERSQSSFHDSSDTDNDVDVDSHDSHSNFNENSETDGYHDDDDDNDRDEFEVGSSASSTRSKRRRLSRSRSLSDNLSCCSGSSSSVSGDEVYFWDYSRQCSRSPPLTTSHLLLHNHSHSHHHHHHHKVTEKRESSWTRRTRIMDTSSLVNLNPSLQMVGNKGVGEEKATCDFEDWEDLKDLFSKAVEQYESDDAAEALPLIRGVVHECHRFLLFYQDPSVLFTNPTNIPGHSPETLTPPDERLHRDWANENCDSKPFPTCKCIELPTAFHAILGTSLFLFGNLIAQDPSLALPGEPNTPTQYWLAALDVFETGENLPSRTSGWNANSGPEDWRMAIVWGRTLVCLADETVTRARTSLSSPPPPTATMPMSMSMFGGFQQSPFAADEEPTWPPESPFFIIAQRRPPVTRRMSLLRSSANDLMKLAMDQFSRGIFHMPHPHHVLPTGKAALSSGGPSGTTQPESFSRAKELFTIASEVLLLAEKLDVTSERQYWASWADSVFNQMKMEADVDSWRGAINRARGRCCLIVGTARAEEFEDALDRGDESVLGSEEAEEARDALQDAVSFFEKAKGSATVVEEEVEGDEELRNLLAEALVTLANLSVDEGEREELYLRAEKESGGEIDLGYADKMDVS